MTLALVLDDGRYEDHCPSVKAGLFLKGILTVSCVDGVIIRIKFKSQQACHKAQCQTGWQNYSDTELFMQKDGEFVCANEPNHFGDFPLTMVIYNSWLIQADKSE